VKNKNLKILYIAGEGRSGSTIIGNILGEMNGCFTVGETWNIWGNHESPRDYCCCGKRLDECSHWREILEIGFGERHFRAIKPPQGRNNLVSFYPFIMLILKCSFFSNEYISFLDRFYSAIHNATGANTILDESKMPSYAFAISKIPGIELRVLHLVRDPRAVFHSWQRKKKYNGENGGFLPQWGLFVSIRRWLSKNLLANQFFSHQSGYKLVKYEDFAQDPQKIIMEIANWADLSIPDQLFDGKEVNIKKEHHLLGSNPVGIQRGIITITTDDAWKHEMPAWKKIVITLFTFPELIHYGYPIIS